MSAEQTYQEVTFGFDEPKLIYCSWSAMVLLLTAAGWSEAKIERYKPVYWMSVEMYGFATPWEFQ